MSDLREMTYRDALNEALKEEMRRDPNVFVIGEEVGHYQGAYKVTRGLIEEFGSQRIVDAPIAEAGFAGLGVGAAMTGLRPVVEFMTWNFSFVAFDQIVSNAAKMVQMSGGQLEVPIVFRGPNASAKQVGSQHSHAVEPMYTNVPGLIVVYPSTPRDAKGLLKTAIRDNNPVIFLEGETLYSNKGPVGGPDEVIPFGRGNIVREGKDCTVVVWGRPVSDVLKVADVLKERGIELEVIDPRTLRPLDEQMIFDSVRKTHRCVVVHEHWPYGGPGAEIVSRVQSAVFDELDAPVLRAHNLDIPMPYAANLEQEVIVGPARILETIEKVLYL